MRNYHTLTNFSLFFIVTIFTLIFYILISGDYEISISKLSVSSFITIFMSIFLQAVPFMLAGVLVSGFIQVFISEDFIQKLVPSKRVLAILSSCLAGAIFPACECGIVPIVRRLVLKGVPLYAAIGFMLTGSLINPLVLFSTYVAFDHEWKMVVMRLCLGFFAAAAVSYVISLLFHSNQLKLGKDTYLFPKINRNNSIKKRLTEMLHHGTMSFFKYASFLLWQRCLRHLFKRTSQARHFCALEKTFCL